MDFLSNLNSPIIPSSLFPTVEKTSPIIPPHLLPSHARKFLEELPPIHYNVFVYIISFFRECLLFKQNNKLSPNKLARICCNCFVSPHNHDPSITTISDKSEEDDSSYLHRRSGMQLIILHFLQT